MSARFLICEDGREYADRFGRFLSAEFQFVTAASFAEAIIAATSCSGLLFDLDFRRTKASLYVDASGAPDPHGAAEVQGILILRALRSRGIKLPALLFADFDDDARVTRLEQELAPLRVIPSSAGLPAIAKLLRSMAVHAQ
jgi:hypothetical protein